MAISGVATINGTLDPGTLPVLRSYEDFYAKQQAQKKIDAKVGADLGIAVEGDLDFHTVTLNRTGQVSVARWHVPYQFTAFTTPTFDSSPQAGQVGLWTSGDPTVRTVYLTEPYGFVPDLGGETLAFVLRYYWGSAPARSFDIPEVGNATFTAQTMAYSQPWFQRPDIPYADDLGPLLNIGLPNAGIYVWLVLGDGPAPAWPISYVAFGYDGPDRRVDAQAPGMPAFTPVPWPF